MHQYCHRCGGELSPGDQVPVFCPHCGAPQLYLQEYDRAVPAEAASTSTGAAPPPHPHMVEWQTAIRCAAFVAVIAAILSVIGLRLRVVTLLSYFWIFSASMTTLTLYQRHRPNAWMDARVGARIGFTSGLLLVSAVTFAMAVAGVVTRYLLHATGDFDTSISQLFDQVAVQISRSAAGNPELPRILQYISSPEFRAGYALFGIAFTASVLLILSTLAGAVGGLLRTRRRVTP
jgi:hypothetical protein